MQKNIDKIFSPKTFLSPKVNTGVNFPVHKSNRVEINDLNLLSKYD